MHAGNVGLGPQFCHLPPSGEIMFTLSLFRGTKRLARSWRPCPATTTQPHLSVHLSEKCDKLAICVANFCPLLHNILSHTKTFWTKGQNWIHVLRNLAGFFVLSKIPKISRNLKVNHQFFVRRYLWTEWSDFDETQFNRHAFVKLRTC